LAIAYLGLSIVLRKADAVSGSNGEQWSMINIQQPLLINHHFSFAGAKTAPCHPSCHNGNWKI
jgi:hypothetical protein